MRACVCAGGRACVRVYLCVPVWGGVSERACGCVDVCVLVRARVLCAFCVCSACICACLCLCLCQSSCARSVYECVCARAREYGCEHKYV